MNSGSSAGVDLLTSEQMAAQLPREHPGRGIRNWRPRQNGGMTTAAVRPHKNADRPHIERKFWTDSKTMKKRFAGSIASQRLGVSEVPPTPASDRRDEGNQRGSVSPPENVGVDQGQQQCENPSNPPWPQPGRHRDSCEYQPYADNCQCYPTSVDLLRSHITSPAPSEPTGSE